jgi:hypothetical protein
MLYIRSAPQLVHVTVVFTGSISIRWAASLPQLKHTAFFSKIQSIDHALPAI